MINGVIQMAGLVISAVVSAPLIRPVCQFIRIESFQSRTPEYRTVEYLMLLLCYKG